MIQDSDKQETAPKFWKIGFNKAQINIPFTWLQFILENTKGREIFGQNMMLSPILFHPYLILNVKCVRHSVLVSTQQRGPTTNLTIPPLLIFYCSSGEPKPLVGREGIFARLMKNLIFCDNGVTFMTIWWPFLTIWWQFLTILRQFLTILWQWYAQVPLPRWSTSDHATPH